MKEKVEYIVSIVNNYEGESITSNPRHYDNELNSPVKELKESMLLSIKKKQEQFIKKKTRLGRRRTSAVGRVPTDYNYLILLYYD